MNRKFLLGVFAFLLLLFSFPKAHAIEGWQYKYVVTIQNQTDKDLTDYQVKIVLDSSNFDFSQAKEDGSDVRFYDGQGNKLPYWIESWDSSGQTAVVWIKVPSIPANGSTRIAMYVGNPSATSESNAYDVFDWYDDASTNRLSEYTVYGSGGDLKYSSGYYWLDGSSTTAYRYLCPPLPQREGYAVYVVWSPKYTSTNYHARGGGALYYEGDNKYRVTLYKQNLSSDYLYREIYQNSSRLYYQSGPAPADGTWIKMEARMSPPHFELWNDYSKTTDVYEGGSLSGLAVPCAYLETRYTAESAISEIRIRKYVYPEPTVTVSPALVGLSRVQQDPAELALDPDASITTVTADFVANFMDYGVYTVTYYRVYFQDTGANIVEGTDDRDSVEFSVDFNAVGDYTICAYVEMDDGQGGTLTDEDCVTTHIDQFPQNVDLDLNDTLIFPGDLVEFNGSATDNGAIVSYSWDFGDGSTATGDVNTHTYATEGTYTVKLTVTDDLGLSKTVSEVIKVYAPPVVRVSRTDDVVEYAVGVESPLVVSSAEWNLSNGTTLTGESVQVSGEEIIYDGNVTFTVTDGVQSQTFERNVPVATINYTVTEGFQPDTQDSVSYSTTFYGGTPTCVFMQDGEEITDTATWKDGGVTFYLECNTPTEEVTVTDSVAVTVKHVMLIDQATGSDANLAEMESVVLKDIDSGQLYDFKANGTTEVYFIKAGEVSKKLRLEMQVATIEDLISIDLITDNVDEDVRLCAGDDFTQFQIITSNAVKPIFVENIYAKCYAWAGRTDYAYQTGMMAKVYTGDYLYAIYTPVSYTHLTLPTIYSV